jgi:hypothetical protein
VVVRARFPVPAAVGMLLAFASCADVLGLKDFELEPGEGGGDAAEASGDHAEPGAETGASGADVGAPEGPEGDAGFDTAAIDASGDSPVDRSIADEAAIDGPVDAAVDVALLDVSADAAPDAPCVGSQTDARNCGACGHDCEEGACVSGVCTPFPLSRGVFADDLVSDGTTLYWVDGKPGGTVSRCGVDACTPTPIVSNRAMPLRVALDPAGQLLWTEFGSGTTADGSVWMLNGSTPTPLAMHRNGPQGIAADASSVYWAELNGNQLVRYTRASGTFAPFGPAQGGPVSIVLDGTGNAYWTASGDGKVNRCPVNNCTPGTVTTLASLHTSPWGVALDAKYVYFTTLQSSGSVLRCGHDGAAQVLIASGQAFPLRMATDETHVYWTDEGLGAGTGSVMRCTDTTCAPIATGLASPAGLAVDAKAVYYGTESDSTLWKMVK